MGLIEAHETHLKVHVILILKSTSQETDEITEKSKYFIFTLI